MTLPTGTLQRQLQQGLDQLRRATDDALANIQTEGNTAAASIAAQMTGLQGIITQLQAIGAGAQTAIAESETDRGTLHALCGWFDGRLKVLEDAAGITAPPNPTT